MKKILLFVLALICFCSCEHEQDGNGGKKSLLMYAECKMDIKAGSHQRKSIEMIGDSVAVHRLCRYALQMCGKMNDTLYANYVDTVWNTTDSWHFEMWDNIQRDTINHTFTFWNDFVVSFHDWYMENGEQVGIEGTEYLGLLAGYDHPVFRGKYDTVEHIYVDPLKGLAYVPDAVYDTLGYIPLSLMDKNRRILNQMLEEKRYQDMIDFFRSGAYIIYTCTGEEYRELVRLGLN